MSDQPESPLPGDGQEAGDRPAEIGPDAPTLAHPVTEATVSPSAGEAPEEPLPVPPVEPDAAVPAPPPAPPPQAPAAPPAPPLAVDAAASPRPPADPPGSGSGSGSGGFALPADRPEVKIGAAFGGGLVLALILKRLAR